MTAPWLTELLTAKGILSEQGLTRTARIRTHKPCHMPCLAGIDDNGLDTWCDLAELHPHGEAHALLEDRWTYDLAGTQLCHRNAGRITWQPAATPGGRPVFAQHHCHDPIPATWTVPPQPATPHRTEQPW